MKRVLVTGGTVRLGAAIAECLRSRGWTVVTSSHRLDSHADIIADLTKDGSAERLYAEAGPLDAIVNNASLFKNATECDIRAVGFTAPRKLIESIASRGGAVVNILDAKTGEGAYYCTKADLREYTIEAAKLFAPKLRVNGVSPGAVFAPLCMHEKAGRNLIGRPKAEDVALAVAFLLENESITGVVLPVDGGEHIA